MLAAVIAAMRRIVSWCLGLALAVLLPGRTLSRPHYVTPDVHVGEPAFGRALEAHTVSRPLDRAVPHRRARQAPERHDHDGGEHHHGHEYREHEQDEMGAKPRASNSRRSGAERQAAGP